MVNTSIDILPPLYRDLKSSVRLNFGKRSTELRQAQLPRSRRSLSYRADSERSTERSRRSLVELHAEVSASRSRLLKLVELQEHHTVAIAPGHTARILCQTVKPNRMMMLIIVA
jgi:hypothetical protein